MTANLFIRPMTPPSKSFEDHHPAHEGRERFQQVAAVDRWSFFRYHGDHNEHTADTVPRFRKICRIEDVCHYFIRRVSRRNATHAFELDGNRFNPDNLLEDAPRKCHTLTAS